MSAFFGNSRWFCYKVASQLNCVVVDTDYRKAPEYPHPYPLLDIEDCVYWLLSQPERYDKDMITMSGFSAGGNLAMSSTNRLGRDIIKALVSFYAPIDATTEGAPIGIRDYPEPRETARSGTHLESRGCLQPSTGRTSRCTRTRGSRRSLCSSSRWIATPTTCSLRPGAAT